MKLDEVNIRTWDQLTKREQLLSTWSDVYKEVNGVRPRHQPPQTDDELEREIQQLAQAAAADEKASRDREQRNAAQFERRVLDDARRAANSEDEADVKRAAIKILDSLVGEHGGDHEFVDYIKGLPYGTIQRLVNAWEQ